MKYLKTTLSFILIAFFASCTQQTIEPVNILEESADVISNNQGESNKRGTLPGPCNINQTAAFYDNVPGVTHFEVVLNDYFSNRGFDNCVQLSIPGPNCSVQKQYKSFQSGDIPSLIELAPFTNLTNIITPAQQNNLINIILSEANAHLPDSTWKINDIQINSGCFDCAAARAVYNVGVEYIKISCGRGPLIP